MKYWKAIIHKGWYSSLVKRAGLLIGFGIFYFLMIRPLRALYSEKIIFEGLLSSQYSIGNILTVLLSSRKAEITYLSNGSLITFSYIPQFGFFFLFAFAGLICLQTKRNAFLGLILFQLILEILIFILFWLGIHYSVAGFVICDFLITYLSPLGCLGFVVYASLES